MSGVAAALLLLAGGAVAALVLWRWPRVALNAGMAGMGLAGLASCAAAWTVLNGGGPPRTWTADWPLPVGTAAFALDGLSAWFLLIIGVVGIAVAIYSRGYYEAHDARSGGAAAAALMNVLLAAMVMTVTAADVVLFMVAWEMMSLSAFLLVGFRHRDAQAQHGAWVYLVATHLATACGVLPVLGAFAARSGSTAFAGFAGQFDAEGAAVCTVLLLLGLLGFGTKAGLMPMHIWLPAAHPVAPSPVSALMSGVVIKTGVYGLLRLLSWLPPLPRGCALVLLAAGMTTAVLGILQSLAQRQYKRALAYSSVENIGIIAMAVGVGMLGRTTGQPLLAILGFGGALFHVLNHAMFKGLLFLSAGAVLHGTRTGDTERLGGVARRDPVNAAFFAVGCVAICGLPPLNGFVGEFLIYSGLLRGAMNPLPEAALILAAAAALALTGGLALASFSRLFGVIFLGEPRDPGVKVHATPPSMLAGMGVLAAACVILGIAAPWAGGLLGGPLAVLHGGGAADVLAEGLAPLRSVSGLALLVLGLAVALWWVRQYMHRRQPGPATRPATWGCGYSAPSPRMQYTGSSYVWELVDHFGYLMGAKRIAIRPRGSFADRSRLRTTTVDAAEEFGYRPLYHRVLRTCARLFPLQHGRIQLYLLYMVATLLVVFAAEACWSPFSGPGPGLVGSVSAAPPGAAAPGVAHHVNPQGVNP